MAACPFLTAHSPGQLPCTHLQHGLACRRSAQSLRFARPAASAGLRCGRLPCHSRPVRLTVSQPVRCSASPSDSELLGENRPARGQDPAAASHAAHAERRQFLPFLQRTAGALAVSIVAAAGMAQAARAESRYECNAVPPSSRIACIFVQKTVALPLWRVAAASCMRLDTKTTLCYLLYSYLRHRLVALPQTAAPGGTADRMLRGRRLGGVASRQRRLRAGVNVRGLRVAGRRRAAGDRHRHPAGEGGDGGQAGGDEGGGRVPGQ